MKENLNVVKSTRWLLLMGGMIFHTALMSQQGISLTVGKMEIKKEGIGCSQLSIKLQSEQNQIKLSSQNYRLYYDARSMKLNESSLQLLLPQDEYQLRIVQHVHGVDGSKLGKLSFSDNLGFVNFSIVQVNPDNPATTIHANSTAVAELCFEVPQQDVEHSIIWARPEKTSEYGRAFNEVTCLGPDNQFLKIPIIEYKDYENWHND